MQGKIKKYENERGFGWIESESQVQLVFFHISEWQSKNVPIVGQRVKFNEGVDRKSRRQATDVAPIIAAVAPGAESSREAR